MGLVEDLRSAREAFERREWVAAYEGLADRDPSALAADDFARLAASAYLLGRGNDAIQALQRGYQIAAESGETLAAVRCGFWLALVLLEGGEPAVAGGWVARCQRLLDDHDGDVVERGYVLVHVMMGHVFAGEFDRAQQLAIEIGEYGRRFAEPNLSAQSLNARGRMLIYQGRVPEGLTLLDEAMVALTTRELSPIFAGMIYCSLVEACQELSDWARATEWTQVLTDWVGEQADLVAFTGQSAVHRGQIMRLRGAYTDAIDEFERATRRYVEIGTPWAAGLAMAECGDVLRLRGDYSGAEHAYRRASEFGHEPQPGLALLWLARRRPDAALAAIRRRLEEPLDPVHRAQLLPGAVDVLIGAGSIDEAAVLSDEITDLAASFGIGTTRALAGLARASVELARGNGSAAMAELRTALRTWSEIDAPYEVARCRFLIGRALLMLGDTESAAVELDHARRGFHDLRALPDEEAVTALTLPATPGGLTAREIEVLRFVADGMSTPAIADHLVLSPKTVERHLANIFAKLGVSSRTAAARFALDHDLV